MAKAKPKARYVVEFKCVKKRKGEKRIVIARPVRPNELRRLLKPSVIAQGFGIHSEDDDPGGGWFIRMGRRRGRQSRKRSSKKK